MTMLSNLLNEKGCEARVWCTVRQNDSVIVETNDGYTTNLGENNIIRKANP